MTEHPDVTLIYLVAATKNYQSLPSGDNRQEKNDEYDHHQLATWPQKRPTIDTVPADFKKKVLAREQRGTSSNRRSNTEGLFKETLWEAQQGYTPHRLRGSIVTAKG